MPFDPINPDNIEGKKFPPVGACIYCGSDGGADGLRDEHIVPYSLDGNAVLQEASCKSCEKITSYLDGYLARSIYFDFRLHAGAQSRRSLPTKREATILIGDERKTIEFDIKDHPHFLNLPVWGRPGIMYAEQPASRFQEVQTLTFFDIPNIAAQTATLADETDVRLINEYRINLESFARAITKIAYCGIIAAIGLKNFRPLLTPSIILGHYPYVSHFVGCDPNFASTRAKDHRRHLITYGIWRHDQLCLILVSVRLFADCGASQNGMPIYEVLVGAPKPASLPILEGRARPILP